MPTTSIRQVGISLRRSVLAMALSIGILALSAVPAMAATPAQEVQQVRPVALATSLDGFSDYRIDAETAYGTPVVTVYFTHDETSNIAGGVSGALTSEFGGVPMGFALGYGAQVVAHNIDSGHCLAATWAPGLAFVPIIGGPLAVTNPVLWVYSC